MLIAEFIFYNQAANANGRIQLDFCRGNQGDVHFRVGLQKHVMPAALYIVGLCVPERGWLAICNKYKLGDGGISINVVVGDS